MATNADQAERSEIKNDDAETLGHSPFASLVTRLPFVPSKEKNKDRCHKEADKETPKSISIIMKTKHKLGRLDEDIITNMLQNGEVGKLKIADNGKTAYFNLTLGANMNNANNRKHEIKDEFIKFMEEGKILIRQLQSMKNYNDDAYDDANYNDAYYDDKKKVTETDKWNEKVFGKCVEFEFLEPVTKKFQTVFVVQQRDYNGKCERDKVIKYKPCDIVLNIDSVGHLTLSGYDAIDGMENAYYKVIRQELSIDEFSSPQAWEHEERKYYNCVFYEAFDVVANQHTLTKIKFVEKESVDQFLEIYYNHNFEKMYGPLLDKLELAYGYQ